MRIAKPMLMLVLAAALAAYAFDCSAMATPEQAMQCCNSMPCSSHGHHSQDCCKTMQMAHAPFVQTPSVQGSSFTPVVLAILAPSDESNVLNFSSRGVAVHCHAPPVFNALTPPPLRI
jgi:hypothetical protein